MGTGRGKYILQLERNGLEYALNLSLISSLILPLMMDYSIITGRDSDHLPFHTLVTVWVPRSASLLMYAPGNCNFTIYSFNRVYSRLL